MGLHYVDLISLGVGLQDNEVNQCWSQLNKISVNGFNWSQDKQCSNKIYAIYKTDKLQQANIYTTWFPSTQYKHYLHFTLHESFLEPIQDHNFQIKVNQWHLPLKIGDTVLSG